MADMHGISWAYLVVSGLAFALVIGRWSRDRKRRIDWHARRAGQYFREQTSKIGNRMQAKMRDRASAVQEELELVMEKRLETETIDKLFLELSQFTTAVNGRELLLTRKIICLQELMKKIKLLLNMDCPDVVKFDAIAEAIREFEAKENDGGGD